MMLREGWDVPAVSVILLLRKFSSRVYGQQVVGRGLRLNVRQEDTQEFCAVVDHEKLNHQWLWDIVGARIRKEVDQGNLFGDDDLPPRRKPQLLESPENLIDIPEPEEEEEADFSDIEGLTVVEGDYPNWEKILQSFQYAEVVEISRVEIESVRGKRLTKDGFTEIVEPPAEVPTANRNEDSDLHELVESLKHNVRDVAAALLAEDGIGSHELGYFYNVLMDHVREKLLDGKSAGLATVDSLKHAIRHRHNIAHNFREKPGLVASMIKYMKRDPNASQ